MKPVSVRHASQVVEMADHPRQAIRGKRDASIRVIFDLVASGEADAALSAGNSGAMLAAAQLVLGRLPGVEAPAVLAILPVGQRRVALLDAGARVEARPIDVVQYALLGEAYARRVLGVPRPRVALLSNGEEASKGTALTRSAMEALARDPFIDFLGYVEGKDVFAGVCDVVATDGFTGNVMLKTAEGAALAFRGMLEASIRRSPVAKLGGMLLRPALRALRSELDYAEYGGAPLVGCDGTVILAHGRSGARAIRSAIRMAAEAASIDLRDELSAAGARAATLF
ncbi:Phosphate:acyl-ACP acyltransferase PlsX [Vulgatibacter incomptus]|uniref:Phosphate acyltransferase n=1 Tax=Vulgatibacter incomptus TaxID=1391653 RepID=A0A0K1PCX1_9BACT|nr:Phosphate:acyl-ACP acyltransferase PlsX [Vulgatibacter incomptus]